MPETTTAPAADVDPIDSLTFTDVVGDAVESSPIPAHMMLGGPPKEEVPEPAARTEGEESAPDVGTKTDAPPPALPEGYTKDSLGRVHGPDGKIISKDALAKLAPPTVEPPKPFQYRAAKETRNVEGFAQNADGSVTVTPEKVSELRQLLNARDMLGEGSQYIDSLKSEVQRLQQENESFKTGQSATERQADALVKEYTRILGNPDERQALEEFFKLRADYPVLLAKAEASYWQQTAKAGRPVKAQQDTTPQETAAPQSLPPRESAMEATTDHVERIRLDFKYRDLTAEDWRQFEDRAKRTPYAYLRPATDAEAKQYRVQPGQIVFDTDALGQDIEQHAVSVRAQRETAAKQAQLAADNARRTAPGITAPPTASGGPPPAKASKPIQSKKDLDDWWDSSEL